MVFKSFVPINSWGTNKLSWWKVYFGSAQDTSLECRWRPGRAGRQGTVALGSLLSIASYAHPANL